MNRPPAVKNRLPTKSRCEMYKIIVCLIKRNSGRLINWGTNQLFVHNSISPVRFTTHVVSSAQRLIFVIAACDFSLWLPIVIVDGSTDVLDIAQTDTVDHGGNRVTGQGYKLEPVTPRLIVSTEAQLASLSQPCDLPQRLQSTRTPGNFVL